MRRVQDARACGNGASVGIHDEGRQHVAGHPTGAKVGRIARTAAPDVRQHGLVRLHVIPEQQRGCVERRGAADRQGDHDVHARLPRDNEPAGRRDHTRRVAEDAALTGGARLEERVSRHHDVEAVGRGARRLRAERRRRHRQPHREDAHATGTPDWASSPARRQGSVPPLMGTSARRARTARRPSRETRTPAARTVRRDTR